MDDKVCSPEFGGVGTANMPLGDELLTPFLSSSEIQSRIESGLTTEAVYVVQAGVCRVSEGKI